MFMYAFILTKKISETCFNSDTKGTWLNFHKVVPVAWEYKGQA